MPPADRAVRPVLAVECDHRANRPLFVGGERGEIVGGLDRRCAVMLDQVDRRRGGRFGGLRFPGGSGGWLSLFLGGGIGNDGDGGGGVGGDVDVEGGAGGGV